MVSDVCAENRTKFYCKINCIVRIFENNLFYQLKNEMFISKYEETYCDKVVNYIIGNLSCVSLLIVFI